MEMSSIAYLAFYEVLYEHFVKRTWAKEGQKAPDSGSKKAWLVKNPETGNLWFHELFGYTVYDPAHFVRKRKEFAPEKANTVQIKDPLFIRTCQFMGFALPDAIDTKKYLTTQHKVEILYQFFLEKHYPEHLAENRAELEVFNHETGELTKSSSEEKNNNDAAPMTDDQLRVAIDEKAVRQLIARFYECIWHSRQEEAWELLAPAFRKRVWKNDFDSFTIGYINTVAIRNLHVFDVNSQGGPGITCKVYYEDDVITYTSVELGNIDKISIADLENFTERVRRLKEAAASAGIEGFEKIELQKFFEPAFSEYVWYKCRIKPEDITGLLPSQESPSIPRLITISCICLDNQWFINAINPVNKRSIR